MLRSLDEEIWQILERRQLRRGFFFCFLQYAGHGDERTALAFTFVSRFHERKNLDRFLGCHGRPATLEEAGDFVAQRLVSATTATRRFGNTLRTIDHRTGRGGGLADAAIRADPAVFPHT